MYLVLCYPSAIVYYKSCKTVLVDDFTGSAMPYIGNHP